MARSQTRKFHGFCFWAVLPLLWGSASSSSAALIKSVQSQSVVIGGSSLGATVVLASPVAANNSFSVFSAAVSEIAPLSGEISGIMNSAGTSMIFQRMGPDNPVTVNFSVASFQSGVAVQRGEVLLGTTSPTTVITLPTAVNLAQSFVILSHRNIDSNYGGSNFVRAQLTGSTQLTLDTSIIGDTQNIVDWQVVDYTGCSVQAGTFTEGAGETSVFPSFATVLPDLFHSALYFTYTSDSDALATDVSPNTLYGQIYDTNNLGFSRFTSGTNLNVSYFLVNFTDGTFTSDFFATSGSGGGAIFQLAPEPIDPGRTILTGGGMYHRGCSTSTSLDVGAGGILMNVLDPNDVGFNIPVGPSTSATIGVFMQQFAGIPVQVALGANTPPNGSTALPGSAAPIMQFYLTNQSSENINSLSIRLLGQDLGGTLATDVNTVQIIRDTDGNGFADAGDVTIGTGTYTAGNGFVTIACSQNGGETLPSGQTHRYLVQYIFSPTASLSNYSSSIYYTNDIMGIGASSGVSITALGLPSAGLTGNSVQLVAPTSTPTITGTPTGTSTPSSTPTVPTSTFTPSSTPTVPTSTFTPSPTPTVLTSTFTPSSTPTVPTSTNTPTVTGTPTNSFTVTDTATNTYTSTATPTATDTPTSSFTVTSTPTQTLTASYTSSPTPTPTFSFTPTNSSTPTSTQTATATATPTASQTPLPKGTFTATPTPNGLLVLDTNYFNPQSGAPLSLDTKLTTAGGVKIAVYNLAGEEVRKIMDANAGPGNLHNSWDGRNRSGAVVGDGLYFILIQTPDGKMIQKVIVLK